MKAAGQILVLNGKLHKALVLNTIQCEYNTGDTTFCCTSCFHKLIPVFLPCKTCGPIFKNCLFPQRYLIKLSV